MPPKVKVTKPDILQAALDLIREKGADGVNARSVAAQLGVSTQPIFSNYSSMDALKSDAIAAAGALYESFIKADLASGQYPPYKATGMAYIRFAREEPGLFRLLFMRDRTGEDISGDSEQLRPLLELIQSSTGIPQQDAQLFHAEMWIFVHGLATMTATGYLQWDWALISRMLTDHFEGLKARWASQEGITWTRSEPLA